MAEGNGQKLTPISELGEFRLIDELLEAVPVQRTDTLTGGGDDAAILDYRDGLTVVSTDSYLEGVHFDLVYTPLRHLGYKCVAASVSDICAMNAQPQHIVVALALSSRFTVEGVEDLYFGIRAACQTYGVDLVGGDTTSSRSGLAITVTALGKAKEDLIAYRKGAQPNDVICVTGDLGGAYFGLQILEREKQVFLEAPGAQPQLEAYTYILQRQLRPEARLDIVRMLHSIEVKPTSMIDISDGLASEILHLCKASRTGCIVFDDHLPMADETLAFAREFSLDPTLAALNGGEDYELLFTVKPQDFEKLQNNPDITAIGYMKAADQGTYLQTRSGNRHELKAQGWKHF